MEVEADKRLVSVKAPNTEVYLHTEMKRLYPNSTVTVTKSRTFNLLAYANQSEDPIILKELEMEGLKGLWYFPPTSRRYATGTVAQSMELGGWQVSWRDEELKVIVASVCPTLTPLSLITGMSSVVNPSLK